MYMYSALIVCTISHIYNDISDTMINNIAINSQHWVKENGFLRLIFVTSPIEELIVKDIIELHAYNETDFSPQCLVCTLGTQQYFDMSIL